MIKCDGMGYYWKPNFINSLIKQNKYKSYLELGIAKKETWDIIECEVKTGIDVNPSVHGEGIINCTTDYFFENANRTYDIVFIDACHEKTQVATDFVNSFNILNKGGAIVLHDIYPRVELGQSLNSHGDCFEVWMNIVDNYPDQTYIATEDNIKDTVGIFLKENLESITHNFFTNLDKGYSYYTQSIGKYIK